ncbi:MAG: hypothetical protein A4E35_00927 [Methanoregula sp. PtaU1.Bin051]|nr:MAG: hypothetical protein A4E35_00927 [Methanoregula sp. PtaU1.Bin051]
MYQTAMAKETVLHYTGHVAWAIAKLLLLVFVLPLLPAVASGMPVPAVLALIISTLVIEYGAAPVGLGFGLHPVYVLLALTSIGLGVTLFLFDILDTIGEHSERVKRFLTRSAERGRSSPLFAKYGVCGLVPCVMTLGFYVCPPVACVFGWKRDHSILMIMAGYVGISIATILLTMGIFDLLLG